MERVCIFIDAGNFYHLVLKKIGIQEIDFNFEKFAQFLAGERKMIKDGKRFYVATVREKKGRHENKRAISNQTRLFTNLSKFNWIIKTSKLRTRIEKVTIDDRVTNYQKLLGLGIKEIKYERSREKGIDVKLATDLTVGAIDDKYDTAILVSSDTDLVPAIDLVRHRFKKKVEYIGFSLLGNEKYEATKPVNRMIYSTDIQRVLIEADIKPFIIKKLF
ncbi:NYN domain-containing protein [bacterium]|nr:NYN domain-containing protein [bacterium]